MKVKAIDILVLLSCGAVGKEQQKITTQLVTEFLVAKGVLLSRDSVFPEYSGDKEYRVSEKYIARLEKLFGIKFADDGRRS